MLTCARRLLGTRPKDEQVIPPPQLNQSDYLQSVVVAAVLVSDMFLTSHAYLKDGAACIRGASVANSFYSRKSGGKDDARKVKAAVNAALSQARLGPQDIQILEEVGSQKSGKALGDLNANSKSPVKSRALFDGTTGLASLCGLGESFANLIQEVAY